MKTLFALAALASAPAFAAPSLNGRALSCEYNSRLDGRVLTVYRFFATPSGKNVVEITENGFNNRDDVLTYSLSGNVLTVEDARYDLSTAPIVSRSFTLTIMPGEDGGDARPLHEEITERCTLN